MRVAGLIAAAGKGQRAGGAKAGRIAGDDPRMFLDRSVSALRSWGCFPVVAVVQEEHKAVARSFGAVAVVPTPLPEAMIDSLRAGIKYLERLSEVEAVLWSPVDCPLAIEVFARRAPPAEALDCGKPVVAGFQGQAGHPVFLPRPLWGRLKEEIVGRVGAKAALSDAVLLNIALESLENRNR